MISSNPFFGGKSVQSVAHSLGLSFLVTFFIFVYSAPLGAQLTGKGAITGIVADKTGAVIPNATISATNTGNGITSTTKSTGAGDFNFSNLDPGIYTVTTIASGFEKLTQQNIHVNAMELRPTILFSRLARRARRSRYR